MTKKNLFRLFVTIISQVGVAIPQYVLAPLLILIFAVWLRWLPSAGWRGPLFIIQPVLTLTVRPLAYFTQTTRAAMLEVLRRRGVKPHLTSQTVISNQ